jgi:hypothetical protein
MQFWEVSLTVCRHIVEVTDLVIPLNSRFTRHPEDASRLSAKVVEEWPTNRELNRFALGGRRPLG